MTDKTAKPDKWQGVGRLADEATVIAAHNWHRPLTEIRERIEAELRRALEPLLEAAHRVSLILPSSEALEAKLAIGREVDKWK